MFVGKRIFNGCATDGCCTTTYGFKIFRFESDGQDHPQMRYWQTYFMRLIFSMVTWFFQSYMSDRMAQKPRDSPLR